MDTCKFFIQLWMEQFATIIFSPINIFVKSSPNFRWKDTVCHYVCIMNVVKEMIQFWATRFYGHKIIIKTVFDVLGNNNKGSPKNSFRSCPISETLSLNLLKRPNCWSFLHHDWHKWNLQPLTVICCSCEVMALWIAVSKSMKTVPTVRYFEHWVVRG